MRRTGSQRRFDLIERIHLDDDAGDAGRLSRCNRRADTACDRDMIVLDHRRIPQAHAVVLRPAHAGGVFLQQAKTGDRLAGIEQGRPRPSNRRDIGRCHRRDARQMLHGVERGPLGGQHRARLARQAEQFGACRNTRPVLDQTFDHDIRIEPAEERVGDGQPGDGDRIAAGHGADEARLNRDHGRRGDVPARPQILGQRRGDEGVEVEALDHARTGPKSPLPTVALASVSMASRLFLA